MPLCQTCQKLYAPELLHVKENNSIECSFCKAGKDTLTITDKNGKVLKRITKQETSGAYAQFLKEMALRPNVQKLINRE
jgi:hypothetical protein